MELYPGGEHMITCERCSGLMIRDSLYYVEDQYLELEVGRCLNCGHTIEFTNLKMCSDKQVKSKSKNEGVLV